MLDGTDVVEVSVGENHCLDPVLAPAECGCIGDEVIDPWHIFLGELKTEIDDIDITVDLDDKTVSTDFLEPTEWIELEATTARTDLFLECRSNVRTHGGWWTCDGLLLHLRCGIRHLRRSGRDWRYFRGMRWRSLWRLSDHLLHPFMN